MNKLIVKTSKFLSLVLRHKPGEIGISLDENGWVIIDILIKAAHQNSNQSHLTRELIEEVVLTNDKQRFSISDDGLKIRANQGHSIDIDLGLETIEPPEILFHGTAERFWPLIELEGLDKRNRQHVHLTENTTVATSVGGRYGKPLLLEVSAKQMVNDGYSFFRSANNVWLVESVPPQYLKVIA